MKITKSRFKEIVREELSELRNISEEATLTGKEVADKMCKSTSTIETWKKNLMKKIGVKSAMGLVRFAVEHGFIMKK